MELPFILVAGVMIGGGVGHWLDGKLGTSPLLMFVLGLAGFGAGVREVLRRIPTDDPQDPGETGGESGGNHGGE